MDSTRFDALARAAGTRRGLLSWTGIWAGVASLGVIAEAGAKRRRRRKRKGHIGHKPKQQQRQYPVFSTCYTAEGEQGPIPDGPYPTCQSPYDPDEFVPCNSSLTFNDLKQLC